MASTSDKYVNYALYRTTPKLSGNVKIDLIIGIKSDGTYGITNVHFRPLSETIPYTVDPTEKIYKYRFGGELAKFYNKTKAYFFTAPAKNDLNDVWPIIYQQKKSDSTQDDIAAGVDQVVPDELLFKKDFDDTYWAGTSRMNSSLYGTTHECLIPAWIEKINSSDGKHQLLTVGINIKKGDNIVTSIEVPINSDTINSPNYYYGNTSIGNWFHTYFANSALCWGNNRLVYINKNGRSAQIRGTCLRHGGYFHTIYFSSTLKNLIIRERPLIESDSDLLSMFSDWGVVAPQLLNFNLCFNLNEILTKNIKFTSADPFKEDEFTVESFVSIGGEQLPKYDIYTNTEYIPRYNVFNGKQYYTLNGTVSSSDPINDNEPLNVLNRLQDNNATELTSVNKITQPICHWQYVEVPSQIFNFYDGFSPYKTIAGNTYSSQQGNNNNTLDLTSEYYDTDGEENIFGRCYPGEEADATSALQSPEKFIEKGILVSIKNNTNFDVSGDDLLKIIKINSYNSTTKTFNIEEVTLNNLYIGFMYSKKPGSTINAPSYPGILVARYDKTGTENLLEWDELWDSDTKSDTNIQSKLLSYDQKYYRYRYADIDNNWCTNYDASTLTSVARRTPNQYGCYILSRYDSAAKNMYIIFWTNYIEQPDGEYPDGLIYASYIPNCFSTVGLTNMLNGFIETKYKEAAREQAARINYNSNHSSKKQLLSFDGVQNTIDDYNNDIPALESTNLKNCILNKYQSVDGSGISPFSICYLLQDLLNNHVEYDDTIEIKKTISREYDNTVNINADEIKYYKYDKNFRVLLSRKLGYIRPAMYQYPGERTDDEEDDNRMQWNARGDQYGRNYLYRKIILNDDTEIRKKLESGTYSNYFLYDTYRLFFSEQTRPVYPSIRYSGIIRNKYDAASAITKAGETISVLPNLTGDLLVDEVYPRYLGIWPHNPDGEDTDDTKNPTYIEGTRWAEYKWFDKSVIKLFPQSWTGEFTITSESDDYITKAEFDEQFEKALMNKNVGEVFKANNALSNTTPLYIKSLYDFTFDFKEDSWNIGTKTFTYNIIATLK